MTQGSGQCSCGAIATIESQFTLNTDLIVLAPCLLPSRSEDGSQRRSERSETVDGRRSGGYRARRQILETVPLVIRTGWSKNVVEHASSRYE
jgi:hypothetical protein